ncbi:uncharacterized protein LOC121526349 [Cheilinus undulatus]|uniref:uncharacterized protein LOC121526349 n=1 Tax=Cheilinus undulatus TaxID=241271 RepID=UPI001BD37DA4|nr:uncharacterized protein LOC121526349 [Cheilinus undulatus]
MARAETIESVGETGGQHNTCRMELPRPFHTWPGLLSTPTITTSGIGTGDMHPHHLHPLQALYLSYPLPYPHPEGQYEPQTHQQIPALLPSRTPPPSPPCNRREERGGGHVPSAFSREQSDLDREEHTDASSRLGPLPDLLPQNEHPSMALRGEAEQELEVRRVAHQLRIIGDEFNATVLRRAHAAPHWQDWRDACRGLLNFITQTLSTLYRLT